MAHEALYQKNSKNINDIISKFKQAYERYKKYRMAYEGAGWKKLQAHVCTKQTIPAQRALQDLRGGAQDSDDKGRNSESQNKG